MKIQVYKDVADEWRWRLLATNGQIVAVSGEGYTQKHNALEAATSFTHSDDDAEIELDDE